jgi:hypothetical protein
MNLPATLKRYSAKICDYENDTRNDNGHWVHLADGLEELRRSNRRQPHYPRDDSH